MASVILQKSLLTYKYISNPLYKKITIYPLDSCVPGCGEADGRGRKQDGRKGEVTSARPDEAEATRVSTKRDVAKESLEKEGVSRPSNSTNRTQKTI